MSKKVLSKKEYQEFAKCIRDLEQSTMQAAILSSNIFGKTNDITRILNLVYSQMGRLRYSDKIPTIIADRKKKGLVSEEITDMAIYNFDRIGQPGYEEVGFMKGDD